MCLAKANCAACLDAALVQDLRVGEGQAVEMGDFLEVSYTGWLMQNHAIGQVMDLFSCSCRFLSERARSHGPVFTFISGL